MSGFPHHLLAAAGAHCQPCSGSAGRAALTIDAGIASAIAATGARTIRDAGRVMAWLVRGHPGWDDRQALHARLCQHLSATGGDP